MKEDESLTGQILGGKYLLGEILGQGGFGTVYKAKHIDLLQDKAIKVITEKTISNPENFKREARILARLSHDNILPIFDYGIDKELPYIVMPYISGGTLYKIVPPDGLSLKQTNIYLEQICNALDFAHNNSIVHLDLKPGNILYQPGNISYQKEKLMLSDFGLAHPFDKNAIIRGSSLGQLIGGTPGYAAPEQLAGIPKPESDIYALGAVLFFMLTRQNAFKGNPEDDREKQIQDIITQQYKGMLPSACAIKKTIPPSIDNIIKRAMDKEPANRYPSAGELFNDFKVKAGLSLPPIAQSPVTKNEPIQSSSVPSTLKVAHTKQDAPKQSGNSAARSTNYDWQLPQLQHKAEETTGSLSLNTITPYAQVQLDTPPPLDVMNRLLQEVGRQVQQRKQGDTRK